MIKEISSKKRFSNLLVFLTSFAIHFNSGYSTSSQDGTDSENLSASGDKKSSNALIIIILLVLLVLLSFLLFKFWQKKKREEQYAQLLKLFEEDDELELELGLRD